MGMIDEMIAYDDAVRRIQELEKLNSLLAEQVDRMRLPIAMAQAWCEVDSGVTRTALHRAVGTYNQTMAQLAKDCE